MKMGDFGVLSGIEFDFGACEWSGTTMGNKRIMNKLLNVNIAPSPHKLLNLPFFKPSNILNILVFCDINTSIFNTLHY